MTDEFAIKILEQYREKPTLINEIETVEEAVWLDEALSMGIKALEQEPKTGHWMGDSYGYICSNCEHSLNDLAQSMDYISFSKPKYCPNCGARMIEPQESEDKECQ